MLHHFSGQQQIKTTDEAQQPGHFGQFDPAAVFALYRDSFSPSEGLEAPHAMLCTSALVGATEEEAAYLAGPSTISWINIRRDTREALPSPEESARRIDAMGGVTLDIDNLFVARTIGFK